MSADACLVFYGIRRDIQLQEVEQLEMRKHPDIQRCRELGLNFFWANFASPNVHYYFFVGNEIGLFGPEHRLVSELSLETLEHIVAETRQKLATAGFEGTPQLYIQWIPDV